MQLAEAMRAEDKLRSRREEISGELTSLQQRAREGGQGAVNIDRMIDTQRYDAVLRAELSVTGDHLSKIVAEVERRRQSLVAADRDVRILERLHDTQYQRHLQAEAQQQNKQLDEVGQRSLWREEG